MADSNFSGPLQSSYHLPPAPPNLHSRNQDPSLAPSGYSGFGGASPYVSPMVHYPSRFQSTVSETPYGPQMGYPPRPAFSNFGPHGGGGFPPTPPMGMFQHGADRGAAPGVALGQMHGANMPGHPRADFPPDRIMDPFPMMGAPPSMYPPIASPPPSDFENYTRPRPASQMAGPLPQLPRFRPGPVHFDGRRAVGTPNSMYPSSSGPNTNVADQHRHLPSPSRRGIYYSPDLHNEQTPSAPVSPERRHSSSFLNAQARRSDRSISPRTSSRRSYDRYSTDLPQSGTMPDAGDPMQFSSRRAARRQRLMGAPEFRARVMAVHDPNIPSAEQMKVLKDKLRHLLPKDLPEGTSTACDICQKDYATEYVQPTEDEEVAIQLPCKHVFGEHCINTWFETCKEHKNKITCPMCRELLIEPRRTPACLSGRPGMMTFFARDSSVERQALAELLGPGGRHFLEHLTSRDLEGDFANG